MSSLWLIDPASLTQPSASDRRKIGSKPLINLPALQLAIQSGALTEDDVVLATRKCEKDLQNLPWTFRDLLDCVCSTRAYQIGASHDFKNSEWCKTSVGHWVACDVYRTRYDEEQRCWNRQALEIYLKFSITEDGDLELLVISAHL